MPDSHAAAGQQRSAGLFASAPWIVVAVGVVVMVILFLVALSTFAVDRNTAAPPAPAPAPPLEPVQGVPTADEVEPSPTGTASPSATPSASASPTPTPTPSVSHSASPAVKPPSAPVTTAPPELTGRYRVVDSFHGGFLGEVLVRNSASGERAWTVAVSFSSEVRDLQTYWVEDGPRPDVHRSGNQYVFTGDQPVRAGGRVTLRFWFDRTGGDGRPTRCSVGGTPCTVS